MNLTINGHNETFDAPMTISALLETLGKNPKLVAVEVNRDLVTRKLHAETTLVDGDTVEIVTLVGGG
ncbi:MAG: sulfur carrier protein ThiS [Phycisphaerales bacterium]|jgi:thiamine biosynthesis protein ThiS|nr:sulfur carrier protein ThiS [Phycisphaerales bacterium]MBT7171533.1 sulfur carrier protein ThiS [Phycisphaerales bacterium]